jgi:CBS domain containing-hemolysin-like protein
MPLVGETFQMDNLEITVEQADEKSIKKVRIVLLDREMDS